MAHPEQAEAVLQQARQTAEAKFEQRKTRIGKAYQSSKQQCLLQVEKNIGARKYELQKTVLQSEKDRESDLAAAATQLQEFKSALAAEQESLARVGGRPRSDSAMSACPSPAVLTISL